jgi:hypothetical protein
MVPLGSSRKPLSGHSRVTRTRFHRIPEKPQKPAQKIKVTFVKNLCKLTSNVIYWIHKVKEGIKMIIKNRYMVFGGWEYEGYDFIGFYDSLDGLIAKNDESYSVGDKGGGWDYINVVDLMDCGAVRGESGNEDMKWVEFGIVESMVNSK